MHSRRCIGWVLVAGLVVVGTAAPAAAQDPGGVRPDPAPAAAHQRQAPSKPATTGGSTHSSSSPAPAPAPAPASTPAPVVSSAPSPAPAQSTPPPAKTSAPVAAKPSAATTAKAKAARAKAARAKAAKVKAARAKAAKNALLVKRAKARTKPAPKPKAVVHAKKSKPAVKRSFVPATPGASATTLPADPPPADDSGLVNSNRTVLLLTIMVAVGAGLAALLIGAFWRRFSWWYQHQRQVRAVRVSVERYGQGREPRRRGRA
jgi:hypothetical protein